MSTNLEQYLDQDHPRHVTRMLWVDVKDLRSQSAALSFLDQSHSPETGVRFPEVQDSILKELTAARAMCARKLEYVVSFGPESCELASQQHSIHATLIG